MNQPARKRLAIALLCGLAGLALNTWRANSAAPLLFGRIVTLPVAILFGPWYGALAAIIEALSGRCPFTPSIGVLPIEALVGGAFTPNCRSPQLRGLSVP